MTPPKVLTGEAPWAPEVGRLPQAAAALELCADYLETLSRDDLPEPMVRFWHMAREAMELESTMPTSWTYPPAARAVRLMYRVWPRGATRPPEVTGAFLPLASLAQAKVAQLRQDGVCPSMLPRAPGDVV